uniref:hypothetical protein n=1 Tax=Paenibacillus xylanexedens TaxID=528191 RepID=UPI00119D624A
MNTEMRRGLEEEGWVGEVVGGVEDRGKGVEVGIEKRVGLRVDVDASLEEAIEGFDDVLGENVLVT